ncbi:polygalacturonase-like [Humulus lupulus]|uniref:polygalacturonase-like n=1 Tax=Humulus lupulus TaxID=3486 RepID=UPI002B401751|nr:polygalacturonase-like [Humulus lupulus]
MAATETMGIDPILNRALNEFTSAMLTLTAGRIHLGAIAEETKTSDQRHEEEFKAAKARYADQLAAVTAEKELEEKQKYLEKACESRDQYKESNRFNYKMGRSLELVVAVVVVCAVALLLGSRAAAAAPVVVSTYNVVSLGGKGDGKTESSKAFLAAWGKACSSTNPAVVYVPPGRFLLKNVVFSGQCKNKAITFRIAGTLVAPTDYRLIGNAANWILFQYVNGVTISGGILDGQGTSLWNCKNSPKTNCPPGATTLGFSNSNNVKVLGVTSLNSQMFHIVINGCNNVKLQGVKITAPGNSPNTDGIHVQLSTGVTILNTKIGTGDDCVSIGPGTANLWIESVTCGPGHGISIGSLGKDATEAGVQNVTVRTVTFRGTQNGVRIKSWGRESSGFARKIVFQHVAMVNVQNPIVIDQNYCPRNDGCPGKVSGVKVSDVTYQDIHGTSATEVAVKFDCSAVNPCSRIQLQDVKLTFNNNNRITTAQASCSHAAGTASGMIQPSSCL